MTKLTKQQQQMANKAKQKQTKEDKLKAIKTILANLKRGEADGALAGLEGIMSKLKGGDSNEN
jgi:hypothetical protein